MALEKYDIDWVGSANMQETDAGTPQGGAIDKTVSVAFHDLSSGTDTINIVSDSASDTTQTVTVTGRIASDAKVSDSATLNGTTPVALTGATAFATILKAVKSGTTVGTIAAYYDTAVRSDDLDAATAATVTLDAGASGSDHAYLGMVLRMTSGDAIGDVRRIIHYDGTNKIAHVHTAFSSTPAIADTYAIYRGVVFAKVSGLTEQLTVRVPFYDAEANETGATKLYHEKIFCLNNHATKALTNGVITLDADPSDLVDFALAATLDDSGVTGGDGTRLDAPATITFNDTAKDVANDKNLSPTTAQGVWLRLTLLAGESPTKSYVRPKIAGSIGA